MNDTILIAAEDPDTSGELTRTLEAADYAVSVAGNRKTALSLMRSTSFALVLVDITAPGRPGYELIQDIRSRDSLPILLLAEKGMEQEVILGLDLGADACLTRPFHPAKVIAYVNAILRRCYRLDTAAEAREKPALLRVGELTLDTEGYQLLKRGRPVTLTSTERKLLTTLMGSPGHVFTKAQLRECVNGASSEEDSNSLTVHISNLRAKIEDNPGSPVYIKTVRGLGYRMEADL